MTPSTFRSGVVLRGAMQFAGLKCIPVHFEKDCCGYTHIAAARRELRAALRDLPSGSALRNVRTGTHTGARTPGWRRVSLFGAALWDLSADCGCVGTLIASGICGVKLPQLLTVADNCLG